MADRENSPAFAALPRSARRVFAAIERAIGDGASADVSYVDFMFEFHVGRQSISKGLKMLDRLGMIEVEAGPRCSNRFRFSNRWRSIDKVEAARLAALAREVLPHRRFSKPPELKPVKPPKQPKPITVARPHVMRRTPSLVRMPWQDGQ